MEVGEGWLASLGLLPGTFHVAAFFQILNSAGGKLVWGGQRHRIL